MQKEITTSIKISATPEKVWSIFTDFESYSTWNPFILKLTGKVAVGNQITAKLRGMTFKPIVLVYMENTEFKWIGKLLVKGLFDGEHRFQLIDNKDGSTTFIQSEQFNGLLVGLFAKKLDTETKDGFEAMNESLKKKVEGN
jgi:hypothetical protein